MVNKIKNKQLIISSPFDINSQRLINVANPTGNTDAANKYYVDAAFNEVFSITGEPTGFPMDTQDTSTLMVSGNTISITPSGTSFYYYIKGTKYTSTGDTLTITPTEGIHYYYCDNTSNLRETLIFTKDLFYEYAYTAVLYWDSTNSRVIYFADERHGYIMDAETHSYLHQAFGTQYVSGLAISTVNPVDSSGDLDGDAQIYIENGRIRDEDILINIINNDPQTLSPILSIPVYYREGTTNWRRQDETLFPIITGGTGRMAYNSISGGIWGQTMIDNNDFGNTHIFATNDIYNPIVAIQGQASYQSLASVRIGANDEINNLVTGGLTFQEFTPIATIIFETSNNHDNTVKSKIVSTDEGTDYIDWRGTKISPGSSVSSHSSLSDLSSDDHLQYALLAGRLGDILHIDTISGYTNGTVSFANNRLIDIQTPINDNDASNKLYVDNTVDSLKFSESDINLPGLTGTSIYLATNTTVQNIPVTNVRVNINSFEVNVGNGVTLADCFFSDDGGSTAKTYDNISQGDSLYWNGNVAPFQIDTTDEIDFIYLTR